MNKEYKLTFKFNGKEHVVTKTKDEEPFTFETHTFDNIYEWMRYIKTGEIPVTHRPIVEELIDSFNRLQNELFF